MNGVSVARYVPVKGLSLEQMRNPLNLGSLQKYCDIARVIPDVALFQCVATNIGHFSRSSDVGFRNKIFGGVPPLNVEMALMLYFCVEAKMKTVDGFYSLKNVSGGFHDDGFNALERFLLDLNVLEKVDSVGSCIIQSIAPPKISLSFDDPVDKLALLDLSDRHPSYFHMMALSRSWADLPYGAPLSNELLYTCVVESTKSIRPESEKEAFDLKKYQPFSLARAYLLWADIGDPSLFSREV